MASNSRTKFVATHFLISNLHCSSCVTAIEDAFEALAPKPASISVSVEKSLVTVHHDVSLPVITMLGLLQDDGYDVVSITSGDTDDAVNARVAVDIDPPLIADGTSFTGLLKQTLSPTAMSRIQSDMCIEKMREKHIEKCAACQGEKLTIAGDNTPVSSDADNPRPDILRSRTGSPIAEDPESLVVIDSGYNQAIWRASFAIGGMTCPTCVETVTKGVEGPEWVKKVSVRLVTASATVDFIGKEHLNAIIESLEDTGMEVNLHEVVNLTIQPSVERTVEIKVDGMFCDSCPGRVSQALEKFAGQVHIEKVLTFQDPIIRLRYAPRSPRLTIREIVGSISDASVGFEASIYHPPTLEQLSAKLHRKARRQTLLRAALSILIAIPTLIIGVVYMSLVKSTNVGRQYLQEPWASVSRSQWILFILATPVYFYSAGGFHERALKEVHTLWKHESKTPIFRRFYRFGSMNMLMSLGTSIAYFSSLAELINAATHHRTAGDNAFYFDSVVFLTMFVLIGRLIEAYSKARTGDAISMLGNLRPTTALLVEQEGDSYHNVKSINVDLLDFGDVVRVLQGASPPSDGTVIDGLSSFDESSLTGEAKFIRKFTGDQVYSGTVNKGSPVLIKITGAAGNSMLDQIVNAVREGQTQHAPIEKLADSLTGYFVPIIVSISVVTWIIWLSLGVSGTLPNTYKDNGSDSWAVWSLGFAIAVFVVACPCGIGLAAPTALVVGSGLAAQNGILAKGGGEAFEKASRLDCIVFDKTGTLTMGGNPVVTDVLTLSENLPQNHSVLYSMVSNLEAASSHPVAKAIVSYCKNLEMEDLAIEDIEEIAGKGMKGLIITKGAEETCMIAGNEVFMCENSVEIPSSAAEALKTWKTLGRSVVLVASKAPADAAYSLVVIFSISDPIRPESFGLVKDLQAEGIDVWLLSGDNPVTARAIGTQVGIPASNIIAGVLPSEKAEQIKYLQMSLSSKNKKGRALVAMVGDGINDAPALSAADVGIAIGSGSDIAISTADFVLISSELTTVLTLLDLSRLVFRRIKFNFGWALVYNMIGVPIAAGVLYPVRAGNSTHIKLDPVWASLAMALSSVSVVCSSLALRSGVKGLGFVKREGSIRRHNSRRDLVV